jgi:alpha-L-fucosidase 2
MHLRFLSLLLLAAGAVIAAPAVQTDIEYGRAGGESLRLDACVPDGPGPFPAVILVHGGAWNAGDKSGGPAKGYMAPMQDPLTRGGFAWFSINYRLAPQYRYPANVEDVETAIRWVKAHAAEYRVDSRRIALAGESAGAHLIAMAVVRANEATRVAAVVPFYGPFNLLGRAQPGQPLAPNMVDLFGLKVMDEQAERVLHEASPVYFVKPGLPPFLLVHGTADSKVPFRQSTDLQAALRQAGVPCELLSIKGGDHGMLSWAKLGSGYQDQVVAWLTNTLAPAVSTTGSIQ